MCGTEILVYTDEDVGASSRCVAMTMASLKHTVFTAKTHHTVRTTNSDELVDSKWRQTCCLLVMPGGRDLPYCKALNGQGNREIREFVTTGGGSYLGLCAGAYYGSANVEFSKGDPNLEVMGSRELAFFPVTARGPVYPGFNYDTNDGASAVTVTITEKGKEKIFFSNYATSLSLYFNGGCEFIHNDITATPYDVMATYTQLSGFTSPAIIGGCVGNGRVILSGLHIEATSKSLQEHYEEDRNMTVVIDAMETSEQWRFNLFTGCIQFLINRL